MLDSIVINNFAIIDHLSIDFEQGMTALTGETGAGKSILLDAIQLVLGDRADSSSVKSGCHKADISVTFNVTNLTNATEWLKENELDADNECLLRRVIQTNGRTQAFINGSLVPLYQLKVLGELLVDLHGQHEHQSLQKSLVQQQLLDASLTDKTLLDRTAQSYQRWKEISKRIAETNNQSLEKQQRIDLLKLYSQEFKELSLQPGELQSLKEEHSRLSHSGQILESSASLNSMLHENENHNIQSQLSQCSIEINQLKSIDPNLEDVSELIKSAYIQVQEASSELRSYQDNIENDPVRLDWLNNRLSTIESLARKHQISTEKLIPLSDSFQDELQKLLLDEENTGQLEAELDQAATSYIDLSKQLSITRNSTAQQLSRSITEVMQTLGMEGGSFNIEVIADEITPLYSKTGMDRIQFLVSANPGQPLKPLHKVASGGELSRISLAIQVILTQSSTIPTLIFDEVDSGIGGGIAEIIGRKLRQVAQDRQVFCVTHLAQVASQAHHHFLVIKNKTENKTVTGITALSDRQRLEETSRMLGGVSITEQTRAHAKEMITKVS